MACYKYVYLDKNPSLQLTILQMAISPQSNKANTQKLFIHICMYYRGQM